MTDTQNQAALLWPTSLCAELFAAQMEVARRAQPLLKLQAQLLAVSMAPLFAACPPAPSSAPDGALRFAGPRRPKAEARPDLDDHVEPHELARLAVDREAGDG